MLWLTAHPLVLASRSEVRRTLLQAAGIPVEVSVPDLDERAVEAGAGSLSPGEAALLLAQEKALATALSHPGRLVLGADQTLALGFERFTKPVDHDAARRQLQRLRGRTHELCAAVAIARDRQVVFSHCDVARLTMRPLSEQFIDAYLETAGAAVTSSVGGYQLEKLGIHLFERIEGDHFTILGLPLMPLLGFLRGQGCVAT